MVGFLEERWLSYDDSKNNGTEWMDEKGNTVIKRKGCFINISEITDQKSYYSFLPEYYLRPEVPDFITLENFSIQISNLEREIMELGVNN